MRINITRIYILVLLLLSLALVGYYYHQKYQQDNFSCEGKLYIQNENNALDLSFQYKLNSGKGELTSVGYFIPNTGESRPVKLDVKFSYRKEGTRLTLTSETTHPNHDDIVMLKNSIPDFFLTRNRGLHLNLYPQGDDGFVFSGDKVPYFFCSKD